MIEAQVVYESIMGLDAHERPRCQFCMYVCRHEHPEEERA